MNDPEKSMNYLIDRYYGEADDKIDIHQDKDMQEKLASSLDKMNAIKDMDFDIDVNIMKTIVSAQEISNKKRIFIETLGFAALCISLLLTVSFIIFKFRLFTQVLYAELLIFIIMPFVIIPFAKYARMKEGNL
jgi:hypothetical protein